MRYLIDIQVHRTTPTVPGTGTTFTFGGPGCGVEAPSFDEITLASVNQEKRRIAKGARISGRLRVVSWTRQLCAVCGQPSAGLTADFQSACEEHARP